MNAARKYSRTNGPGCITISKPIVTRSRIPEVKDKEFEAFFADKDNVSMSSYKVHSKTNLPTLYLKDNKEALWKKFEATYPDGIKRTSFMARLANGQFVYCNDLDGLCSICNEYFYEVFDTLTSLIQLNITDQGERVIIKYMISLFIFLKSKICLKLHYLQNKLITELEKLRVHLRRGFEEELTMNGDGTTIHASTINHCLLYAFGECYEQHTDRCAAYDHLFVFIQHLMANLEERRSTIEECKEKLYYF